MSKLAPQNILKNRKTKKMDSKEGLLALFEYATEGILVTNEKGEIIKINPSAEKLFGYEHDELLGQVIETLIPQRHAHKHVGQRAGYAVNPHPRAMGIGMDLYARRKDNSEFPVEVSLSPMNTKAGRYVIAFIIDITIRKKQDDLLKQTHKELKHFSEELKASNSELENFAYISSHDLQEPLRKIQAFGDRLKTTEGNKLSEQGKDYLERMLNAADRMQTLINDLLSFSRLTSRIDPFESVNLNTILQGVLSDMEIGIEVSKAKIEAQELPTIDAAPLQMRQLFQNMISNAIKFRKDGETPVVKIYSKTIPPKSNHEKEMIELYFEDNGIGFDEKYNDRIFNIFQRLEGKKYDGSGIGLAICRKIAMKHGGNIVAKSQINKGSTFIVSLAVNHDPNTTKLTEYK